MEASVAHQENVTQALAITHVWSKVVELFIAGEYDRARITIGLVETMESMTAKQYLAASTCNDQECDCRY